ncbi:MAG: glycoside hydrolase family 43 protein [Clostridia bacterium]|nr:glycoside hydrolase family 43 protein [Clostridia bacterium]
MKWFHLTGLMLMILCLSLLGTALAEDLPIPRFRDVSVHDPSVIRAGDGTFYIYGSHMAAAKSTDLISWDMISRDAKAGCTLFTNVQEELQESLRYAQTDTFWAPDVQQLDDGRYYLYYCTCRGDSPLSMLGVAVSDSPEGPFENLGTILKSGYPGYDATRLPNVVDPCVFFDRDHRLWMVYGSYSGGIFILEMDPATGFPLEGQVYGKKLLGKNHARIEGPYILYSPETDYYYLFLSFGGLNADDGYNIRVCRSRNPDGPYEDALGQDMLECGGKPGTFFHDEDYEGYGVKLMGGYCFENIPSDTNQFRLAYRSPGHNSAYFDEETGRYFLVFHTRFAASGETFRVRVHQMVMNDAGWPVVLPQRYAGENVKAPEHMEGLYKVLFHLRDINKVEHTSVSATLNPDGTVSGDVTGTYEVKSDGTFTCTLGGLTYDGIATLCLDSKENAWVPCFSAMDGTGLCVWGTHAANED